LALTALVVVAATWFAWPRSADTPLRSPSPPGRGLGEGALTSGAESLEARAAPIAEAYHQFVTELDDVQQDLTGATPETFYLQQGDDPWARALETLKQDVTQMELNDR